jgi:hypothetical protein
MNLVGVMFKNNVRSIARGLEEDMEMCTTRRYVLKTMHRVEELSNLEKE